jgi:tmRNA-binding protein
MSGKDVTLSLSKGKRDYQKKTELKCKKQKDEERIVESDTFSVMISNLTTCH